MEASRVVQAQRIGTILVEKNLITAEQLERALVLQEASGERLGEIVVAEFGVSRLELAGVLAEQWTGVEKPELEGLEPVEPLTPEEVHLRRPLGELLVQRGLISSEQLSTALDEQRKSGTRLGEILVERGAITRLDLAAALSEHGHMPEVLRSPGRGAYPQSSRSGAPAAPESTLGWSVDDSGVVADLEARLRALERAAGGAPWQEDLRLVAFDIRAAVSAVEERLETAPTGLTEAGLAAALAAVNSRIQAIEDAPVPADLGALRQEFEELKTRPVAIDGIEDLRAAVDRLETLPDRGDEIPHLTREVAALATRLDELPRAGELQDRLEAVSEKAEIAQTGIEGLVSRVADLAGLEGRLEELAARLPGSETLEDLRRALAELEAQAGNNAGAEQTAGMPSLIARVDLLAARIDDSATAPVPDLAPMIDFLSARIDEVASAIPSAESDGLQERIELLEEESRVGSGAFERLSAEIGELQRRTSERLDDLAMSVPDMSAVGLESRVGELEDQLAATMSAAELREEVQRLASSSVVERESLAQALFARVEEITSTVPRADELVDLRSRLDELAARPTEDQVLQARLDELSVRLERLGAVDAAIADLGGSLAGLEDRFGGGALATEQRLRALEAAIESLTEMESRVREGVGRDLAGRADALATRLDGAESRLDTVVLLGERVAALATDLERRPDSDALAGIAAELRAELAVLADRAEDAVPGEQLEELSRKIESSARDGHGRIDGLAEELNRRISGLADELGRRVDDIAGRSDGLVSRDEAAATAAAQADWVRTELDLLREWTSVHAVAVDAAFAAADDARVTGQGELGNRIDEAAGAIRADLEAQANALGVQFGINVDETAALRARVEELQEAAAGRAAWEERLEEMLEQRLAGLAERITDEVAGARSDGEQALETVRRESESLGARIDELHGLRSDDLAAAELSGAALAARIDDHALRSAAAAFEVEQALRDELGGVAARLEERDASGIEAREELRGELERAASSLGWRLERIEESLASDESADLQVSVEELGRRLEEQAAIGAEQVRVTERALRKGLASLGGRLVDTEAAYADAGNALRRSIERLGAAVVEADARMADQIPVSEKEGCVAFAPTTEGYRLVELHGTPPEIGSTIELDVCDAPLVVTRYGRSPLPLDSRPCAYLDRA